MKVRYTCLRCGEVHTFTPQEYEEQFSWADPHNPYQGEFIQCPDCYATECVSERGIHVDNIAEDGSTSDATFFSPDGVFLYLEYHNGEVKQFL